MRTFLALCGSVGMTRRIVEAMEPKAAELAQSGWKLAWVPPANLHVTLKFFGSIPAESIDAISLACRRRLADLPAPVLRFRGVGAFPAPSEGAPRVLWVGVEGGKALTSLQQTLETDLEALGFSRSSDSLARAYHPHLTVARVLEAPSDVSAWKLDQDFGEEKITEIVIYESRVDPSSRAGIEYRALARVPFSK